MSTARAILRGSGSNLVRIALTSLAGIALPPVLTRLLSTDEYSAWVTLLQLSTYIGLLDIGLQTVVARFVAEHHAKGEFEHAVRTVRTASRILLVGATVGCIAVLLASTAIPSIFPGMPPSLYGQTQMSLLLVGFSSALTLPFGPFLSAFIGLQRYGFPTVIAVSSRLLSAGALVLGAVLGSGIVAMALALALVNLATAALQALGWRRMALPVLQATRAFANWSTAKTLLSTGGLIALWSLGGIFVNGLDVVIVGHFDFASAGAFAVSATAVSFLITILAGVFSPLMPAAAAQQGPDALTAIRALTIRATRYSTLVIVLLGGGLVVFAYPLLAFWVGSDYATDGAPLLRMLVLGHCIRQLGYAYSLVVVARGKQRPATIATMSEAVVNLAVSVVLAQTMGALGVAIGTVCGAVVSVGLHLIVTMHYTADSIPVTRKTLVARAVLLPLACALPLLVLVPTFDGYALLPAAPVPLVLGCAGVIAAVGVFGLTRADRAQLSELVRRFSRRSTHAY